MRFPVNRTLPLAALTLLLCAELPAAARDRTDPYPANGPQADYPMVLGKPFIVDGVTYTPADTLNYDVVGWAATSNIGSGISASHRTLPLPSYVEITALETGRTILVRLERRGPMTGDLLTELSPAAAEQLGIIGQGVPPCGSAGSIRLSQSAQRCALVGPLRCGWKHRHPCAMSCCVGLSNRGPEHRCRARARCPRLIAWPLRPPRRHRPGALGPIRRLLLHRQHLSPMRRPPLPPVGRGLCRLAPIQRANGRMPWPRPFARGLFQAADFGGSG